jgi:orotidine-5'-phosphate decarboxylase
MLATEKLIVAIDHFGDDPLGPGLATRLYIDAGVRFFKLRTSALLDRHGRGKSFIEAIRESEADLMLDLKAYGTAEEVYETVKLAFDVGARFVTVMGERRLLEAALRAKPDDPRCSVLAVPTTTDVPGMDTKLYTDLLDLPVGFVGSAMYAHFLSRVIGDREFVSPAIRGSGLTFRTSGFVRDYIKDHSSDHIASPLEALQSGATRIVVGRPITKADDPLIAVHKILQEMEAAS